MNQKEIEEKLLHVGDVTTKISQKTKVHGTRQTLPLNGREIEIVYYSAKKEHAPLLVGMHGGGFLIGGCAFDDHMWTVMCETLEINIVSIGYRKTPKYPYPAALNDVYEGICYLMDERKDLDFDRERVSVFGNSAGGTLAAAVCLKAKKEGTPKFQYQVLDYPFLDLATDPADKPGAQNGKDFTEDRLFNTLYRKPEQAKEVLVSPVFASTEQLKGLPETIVIYAEDDELRVEAEEYTRKLRAAGVTVWEHLAANMPHAFFEVGFGKIVPESGTKIVELYQNGQLKEQLDATLSFIKKHLI